MKKVAAAAACLALSLALVGCGGGETPAQDQPAGNDAPAQEEQAVQGGSEATEQEGEVVIVESGWSAEGDYVMYGIILKNEGSKPAEFPQFQVTAKDASGAIVSSHDQTLWVIYPGETVAFGSQAGKGFADGSVEFTMVDADFTDSPMGDLVTYQTDGVSEQVSDYGSYSWVGMITNTSDIDCESTNVSVILRSGGEIVAGYSTYVDNLKAGGSLSFEVNGYNVPEHDSFEVYAMAW